MIVQSIMTQDLRKIHPDETVKDGLKMMHEHHVRTLAVVNEDNQFVGLFGLRQLVDLLLPKVAQMEYGLTNLSFMPDDMGELYHRLQSVGKKPVSQFLESKDDLLLCSPETPLPEVLELLHQSFNTSLPVMVVAGEKNKLVGMVSAWDVLEKLVMNVYSDAGDDAR
ncbi:MAG: CBS domain-containing protein [Gammaproteobacteria bacterium]|jgi:CBS domain-containing protein|nr:CBS domain-containing protein [Gammaproteobacteria bacterium]